jgi:Zn-dependent peptidase ImmA (M78 family)
MKRSNVMRVILSYWDGRLPVDSAKLARSMGITVDQAADLKPGVFGGFEITERGPRIFVSAEKDEVGQRFIVAYELGHYVLEHGDYFEDTADAFADVPRTWRAAQASLFAQKLLVPDFALETAIMKRNILHPRDLMKLFGVTSFTLYYRLEELGWIPCKADRDAEKRAMRAELQAYRRMA